MNVNIALLTVTDSRTFDNDKSGAILVKKIEEAKHSLIDRKICKDNKEDIVKILKDWINQKNIDVITSVEASTNAVAELTISLAVSLARSIPKADAALKNDLWLKNSLLGNELRGKTFGVIGMGRIGRRTARLAVALEMNVLGFEKEIIDNEFLTKYHIKQIEFEDLLKNSDFVSLHLPLTSETTHMMGSKQFDMMKNSAYLICLLYTSPSPRDRG